MKSNILRYSLPPAIIIGLGFVLALGHDACQGLLSRFNASPLEADQAQVCFTPAQRCEPLIVASIASAKGEILVQAYSFTARPIANALIDAKRRGVDVRVLIDGGRDDEHKSASRHLLAAGIPLKFDYCCQTAHNKIMIIDAQIVITGSYNWSASAESRNAENVLVLKNEPLAVQYRENWIRHDTNAGISSKRPRR